MKTRQRRDQRPAAGRLPQKNRKRRQPRYFSRRSLAPTGSVIASRWRGDAAQGEGLQSLQFRRWQQGRRRRAVHELMVPSRFATTRLCTRQGFRTRQAEARNPLAPSQYSRTSLPLTAAGTSTARGYRNPRCCRHLNTCAPFRSSPTVPAGLLISKLSK